MASDFNYISSDGLKNLSKYKYHCVDNSWVAANIGQPFWRWAVNLLPMWLAPNLVTLIGFSLMLSSFVTLWFYCPTATEEAPRWVYLMMCVCLFLYQQLDALDGKQARRTGSSSPLGELFDHGCDAMATVFLGISIASIFRFGTHPWLFFLSAASGFVVFFLAQWEEYHTSVMYLGHLGVTEFHLITESMYFATFYFGPDMWWSEVPLLGVQVRMCVVAFLILGTFTTVSQNVMNVIAFYKEGKTSETHPAAKDDLLLQLLPMTHLVGTAIAWAFISPTLLVDNAIAFICGTGYFFCYLVGRIVVSRVCKERFSPIHPVLLAYTAGAFLAALQFVSESVVVWLLLALGVGTYLHFALNIIRQMCDYLGIMCLRIPTPKKQ